MTFLLLQGGFVHTLRHPNTVPNNKSSLATKYEPKVLPVDVTAERERDPMKIEGDRKHSNVVRVMPKKGYKNT